MLYKQSPKTRKIAIWGLRIAMPLIFYYFAIQSAATSFASGEVGVGLMVWFNVIVLLIMSPTIKRFSTIIWHKEKAGIGKTCL